MKKNKNQEVNRQEKSQEEIETIQEITNDLDGQPVPQPKDYEEIEY
ncbi:hypothetical protein [Peribacillus alkalitolerans]|nr:hypothetical protein [Peribacillus alkalitolerans]